MIYTVISDYKKLLPEIMSLEGGINSPFSLLPDELKEYIREPKSEEVRLSRLGGYLLLFHTVRFLFGEMKFDIAFDERGKPHFKDEKIKNIGFNISHSGGLCAVTVTDEPISVGVDIQEFVDKEKEDRLKDRLYSGEIKPDIRVEPIYLYGGFSAFGDCIFAEIPYTSLKLGDPNSCFTDRWSLSEAVMKCDGRGFGAFTEIEKLLNTTPSETVLLSYKGKRFSISTAKMESR